MLKLSGQLAALLAMLFCSSLQAQQQSATLHFYAFLKSEGISENTRKLRAGEFHAANTRRVKIPV
jgi:ABC-type glycerol-3-phosphate transport system substrate-binding protein